MEDEKWETLVKEYKVSVIIGISPMYSTLIIANNTIIIFLNVADTVDLKYSHQKKRNVNYLMG